MADNSRPFLVAWEQGGNLGHLMRVTAVVESLKSQRREVVLALSPALAVRYAVELKPLPCTRVVVNNAGHRPGGHSPADVASYAGVLAAQGWTDAQWLQSNLKAWSNLYKLVRPAAVVLDYAPVALLAACFSKVPALQVSSGFDAPPPQQLGIGRFRSRTGAVSLKEHAEVAEVDAVLAQIAVSGNVQGTPSALREILSYPQRLLDCLPQTDLYGARGDAHYAPFLSKPASKVPATWPGPQTSQTDRAFVYLRDPRTAEQVLPALARRGVSTLCFWPGHDGNRPSPFGDGVDIRAEPMDLHEVFQNVSLVVGYGSIGIATRAVVAGVPQLLVPTDVEKGMLAQRIHEQRLGIYLDYKRIPGEVDQAIELLLKTGAHRKTCQEAQRQYLGRLAAHSFEEALVSAAHRLEGTTS